LSHNKCVNCIKRHVPEELRAKHKEGLDVGLEDKRFIWNVEEKLMRNRSEEYKEPPPPKYIEYSGQGVSLGGNNPISSAVETGHNVKAEPPKVYLRSDGNLLRNYRLIKASQQQEFKSDYMMEKFMKLKLI